MNASVAVWLQCTIFRIYVLFAQPGVVFVAHKSDAQAVKLLMFFTNRCVMINAQ
jgi:hypothetical protein